MVLKRATIKLDGADHIIFNGLVIEATGSTSSEYGYGVQLMNDADSNVVNNCTIKCRCYLYLHQLCGDCGKLFCHLCYQQR